jgi:hypothetical protein
MPWIAGIDPDVEWVYGPNPGPYRTRREAVTAIVSDWRLCTPDPYGNEPHPWVMKVVREGIDGWEPPRCACYGRHECPACQLAREYLTAEEIEAARGGAKP